MTRRGPYQLRVQAHQLWSTIPLDVSLRNTTLLIKMGLYVSQLQRGSEYQDRAFPVTAAQSTPADSPRLHRQNPKSP
jgi:hypothetical protein